MRYGYNYDSGLFVMMSQIPTFLLVVKLIMPSYGVFFNIFLVLQAILYVSNSVRDLPMIPTWLRYNQSILQQVLVSVLSYDIFCRVQCMHVY